MAGAAARVAQLKAGGNAAYKANDLDRAVKLYSAAIAADPRKPVLIANRSVASYECGHYAAALADVIHALECGTSSALVPKLALRAERCTLWLGDVDAAERWRAHGSLTGHGSDAGTASAAAAVPASMALQVAAVAEKVRACRMAEHDSARRASAARAAELVGAESPALARGGVRPERCEMFTTGQDPPISMLAGARRTLLYEIVKFVGNVDLQPQSVRQLATRCVFCCTLHCLLHRMFAFGHDPSEKPVSERSMCCCGSMLCDCSPVLLKSRARAPLTVRMPCWYRRLRARPATSPT